MCIVFPQRLHMYIWLQLYMYVHRRLCSGDAAAAAAVLSAFYILTIVERFPFLLPNSLTLVWSLAATMLAIPLVIMYIRDENGHREESCQHRNQLCLFVRPSVRPFAYYSGSSNSVRIAM